MAAELTMGNRLGFGFLRLPVFDENDAGTVDYDKVCALVDEFLAQGFVYFDTAYNYHKENSEVAIRKALVDRYPRDAYLLADKMPIFYVKKTEDFQRFFDEQIQRLGVDYFDYYLLHNLSAERFKNMEELGGFDFIRKVKEDGKAKEIGFSFHDKADVLDEILTAHPEFDFVQLQLNYIDWESESIQSRKCYEVARKHGKPIHVMEPVKGGALQKLSPEAEAVFKNYAPDRSNASWAIRFVASQPGIRVVLSGMNEPEQIRDNCGYMKDFTSLTPEEFGKIDEVIEIIKKSQAIQCTNCKYCMDECPMNVNIPGYFAFYNSAQIQSNFIDMLWTRVTPGHALPWECIECRSCESHCPQHLPITDYLKMITKYCEDTFLNRPNPMHRKPND